MNIIIVGGGNVGFYLAERLSASNYIVLIEKDIEVGKKVADKSNILVISGDGCDINILKQAGIAKADVLAAVTGSDVDNLVVCQIGKDIFNVKRTVAKINDPRNEKIYSQLGVDVPIGSTSIIAKVIEDEVSWEDFINLFTFKRGNLSILRVDIPENSPIINIPVNEIRMPEESVMVSVIRKGEMLIPRGNFIINQSDEIIAMTKVGNEAALLKTLMGEIDEK